MKKIKVLIIDKMGSGLFTNADIFELYYNNKTRIMDLYKKIDKLSDYNCYDKYIDSDFEMYLRACYGHEKGKIDWSINIEKILVCKIKEYTNNDFIVINVYGGIGGPFGKLITEKIVELIFNFFFEYILYIAMTYTKARNKIKNETGYDIEYISKVIYTFDVWNYGFISNKNFEGKKKVEKRIMKKLGYKLINNNWILSK